MRYIICKYNYIICIAQACKLTQKVGVQVQLHNPLADWICENQVGKRMHFSKAWKFSDQFSLLKFVSAKMILKLFQEFWHKYLWTQYQWRCCCWVHEAPLPSIRHLRQTVHWDGHPNKSCVKIWNPKAPTNFHVWKNSARVKRGPFPFLLQPGCRTWWLPWSHSRALTHAPWAANQHGLATNYALEDKWPRKCVFNVQQ